DQHAQISWPAPTSLPPGTYTLYVELAKEFDVNATYNSTTYPPPSGIPWMTYGLPYRGQPSIVYSAQIALGAAQASATSLDYIGYGDPDGNDRAIRPPDSTITTDTPGSGASRLEIISDGSSLYRLKVSATTELDPAP